MLQVQGCPKTSNWKWLIQKKGLILLSPTILLTSKNLLMAKKMFSHHFKPQNAIFGVIYNFITVFLLFCFYKNWQPNFRYYFFHKLHINVIIVHDHLFLWLLSKSCQSYIFYEKLGILVLYLRILIFLWKRESVCYLCKTIRMYL